MKVKSLLIGTLSLLLFATSAIADPTIDNEHPYLRIGTASDHTMTVYVGAYKDLAPIRNKHGITIIRSYVLQTVAENGSPKGKATEAAIAADCDKQVAKSIILAYRKYEGANIINTFDSIIDAYSALDKKDFTPIEPNTVMAMLVDAGCKYVQTQPESTSKKKPKSPDIES